MSRDLDESEQAAAIVQELQGSLRDLFRSMTHADYIDGCIIDGQQVDPVTFIIARLHQTFATVGEGVRLQARQSPTALLDSRMSAPMNFNYVSMHQGIVLRVKLRSSSGLAVNWEG